MIVLQIKIQLKTKYLSSQPDAKAETFFFRKPSQECIDKSGLYVDYSQYICKNDAS